MQDTNLPPGVPAAGKPADIPNQPQPAQNPAPQPAPADDPVLGNQPQPAAAPQPEPQVPTEPEQTDPAAGQITLQTGDAAVDAGLQMLAQVSGCTDADVERAMGNALRYGDASLIDEKFLQERLGNYAGYAKTLAETYLANAASNTERTVNEVHTLAGGAEAWAQARDVFMANAPAHIQTAVKTMANSGLAKDAAQMVLDYARQSGALPVQGQHIHGMGGQVGNTALSAAEFSKELADLRTKFGNTSFESGPAGQAYQNLLERRARGKQLGR
ncbi:putative scaffolding protein [Vibrio phage vB_VpP_HA7]|nr:putative scaffolding protein [Vibrio phage vB_VpP_HA7]